MLNEKILLSSAARWIKRLAGAGFLVAAMSTFPVLSATSHGVLVMAHGGSDRWNTSVEECVKQAHLSDPVRVFFGMGCTKKEAAELQRQIQELESQGVRSITVVPLIISSYSEVYRQWRYLLGLEKQPGFDPKQMAQLMGPMHVGMPGMPEMAMFEDVAPVPHQAAITFPSGLDDDPVVSNILLHRALEISHDPKQEAVVIVAHGPNQNADNQKWLANLQRIAAEIQAQGNFSSVEGSTLRDDAPPAVRNQAVQQMRDRVAALGKNGKRVLIVPLLLAPGGIENKIRVALQGLDYTFNSKMLLPDAQLAQWIRRQSSVSTQ